MILRHPRATLTDTLLPYTTLFLSAPRQPDVIDVAVPAGEQNALVLAQEHVDIGRDRPRLRDAGDLPHFDIELARRLAAIVEGSRDHPLPERFQDLLLLLQRNLVIIEHDELGRATV